MWFLLKCTTLINEFDVLLPPASPVEVIDRSRVSMCLCVHVSVSQRSQRQTVWHTDAKIGIRFNIDHILDEFDGQGHRSKVKVTRLENVILWCLTLIFDQFTQCKTLAFSVTSYDVMLWHHDVMGRHNMTSWQKDFRAKELYNTGCGKCVNAQAFSFKK